MFNSVLEAATESYPGLSQTAIKSLLRQELETMAQLRVTTERIHRLKKCEPSWSILKELKSLDTRLTRQLARLNKINAIFVNHGNRLPDETDTLPTAEDESTPEGDQIEGEDDCLSVSWSPSGMCPCCGVELNLMSASMRGDGTFQLCNECGWESEITYDL